ncbi:MAG: CU044_2847 family protein [Xenococcaceae cyanobacterium]
MKRIIEFPLEDGESIFVEVEETEPVDDRIGLADNVAQVAKNSFESAIDKIKPVANAVIGRVRSLNEPADEVEVKFGLKMSAEMGAVIAAGNAEVNYEITLKWKQK